MSAPVVDRRWHGPLGIRTETGHCSNCGWGNFTYSNGNEFSECGVRGYRCVNCETIKPERSRANAKRSPMSQQAQRSGPRAKRKIALDSA